jgi:glycosyltransferase involved in cell wall biosynthesis
MACGCPVVANNMGSMSELIIEGKTGFLAHSFEELLAGVKNIGKINRLDCREYSLQNFSARRMAQGYLGMYEKAIELSRLKKSKSHARATEQNRHKLFLGFGSANT